MSKNKNSNLIEIRDLLKEEMDKFTLINNEIVDNQNDFEKISENYTKYSNRIDKSKSHISDLKKQEFLENLFIYIGFYFFFGCVIYVLLKRFPIHKIIFFTLRIFKNIVGFFIPFHKSNVVVNNTTITTLVNETITNTQIKNISSDL